MRSCCANFERCEAFRNFCSSFEVRKESNHFTCPAIRKLEETSSSSDVIKGSLKELSRLARHYFFHCKFLYCNVLVSFCSVTFASSEIYIKTFYTSFLSSFQAVLLLKKNLKNEFSLHICHTCKKGEVSA